MEEAWERLGDVLGRLPRLTVLDLCAPQLEYMGYGLWVDPVVNVPQPPFLELCVSGLLRGPCERLRRAQVLPLRLLDGWKVPVCPDVAHMQQLSVAYRTCMQVERWSGIVWRSRAFQRLPGGGPRWIDSVCTSCRRWPRRR